MRITRSDHEVLVILSEDDAKTLMQTCALVVTAVHAQDGITLPGAMQTVLCRLFAGLRDCSKKAKGSQG